MSNPLSLDDLFEAQLNSTSAASAATPEDIADASESISPADPVDIDHEDEADDVVHALFDPGEIRQDQVDAGLALLGEENATVHDQELAPVLEDVHVAADLAETSQRDHSQCAIFQGRGFAEVLVQRLHGASLPRQRAFPRIVGSLRRVGPLTLGSGGGRVPSHRRGRG